MKPQKVNYHHGNLKSALIKAGFEILKEEGYPAVTLRYVARRANVSEAAPYHHFKSKYELLCEIAALGFDEMAEMFSKNFEKYKSSNEYLFHMMVAYVEWAKSDKNLYQLISGKDIPFGEWPENLENSYNKALKCLSDVSSYYVKQFKSNHNETDFTISFGLMLQGLATTTLSNRMNQAREKLERKDPKTVKDDITLNDEERALVTRVLNVLVADKS